MTVANTSGTKNMEPKKEYYYEPEITVGVQRSPETRHGCVLMTERQSKRMKELMAAGMSHYDAVFQAQKECPLRSVTKEEYERLMKSEFIQHEEEI